MVLSPARVAAVVLPLVVLIAAFVAFTRPEERARSTAAVEMDELVAKVKPSVVILGNSKARTDIDSKVLGEALGQKVLALKVDGSSAPAWYGMLEQRVFGEGVSPKLVVIYGQLGAMVRAEVSTESERQGVVNMLDDPSPVLESKVLGDINGRGAVARRKAQALHDGLQTTLRDVAVGAILGDRSSGLLASGEALAGPALGRVFGKDARFVKGAPARVVPVAEARTTAAMTAGDIAPADSLLPDLDALARRHGARLVFVRAPLPPASTADRQPAALERDALAVINQLGDSWIDLSTLPLQGPDFSDDFHAGPSGRAAITRALGDALLAHDVLGGGVIVARPPIVPETVERIGSLPPLPDTAWTPDAGKPCAWRAAWPKHAFLADEMLTAAGMPLASPLQLLEGDTPLAPHAPGKGWGDACSGAWVHHKRGAMVSPKGDISGVRAEWTSELTVEDADGSPVWWVYPGTSIRWSFAEAPEGPIRVVAEARSTPGTDAVVRVNGAEVPFVAEGRLLRATVDVGTVTAPWTIEVRAGEGTWLVLDELGFGGDTLSQLVAAPRAMLSPLFTRRRPDPPPPPVAVTEPSSDGGLTAIGVPGLAGIADDTLLARIGRPCSPLVLERGGAVAGVPHVGKPRLATTVGWFHAGERLLASAGEDAPTVTLDPKRKCRASIWVYPGETLAWAITGQQSRKLRLPADLLVLEGIAVGAGEQAEIQVALDIRGVPDPSDEVQTVALPTQGGTKRICVPLEHPVPVGAVVALRAVGAADTWFLLDRLDLVDREHAERCGE